MGKTKHHCRRWDLNSGLFPSKSVALPSELSFTCKSATQYTLKMVNVNTIYNFLSVEGAIYNYCMDADAYGCLLQNKLLIT